jgi:hypothetical protein
MIPIHPFTTAISVKVIAKQRLKRQNIQRTLVNATFYEDETKEKILHKSVPKWLS